MHETSQADSGPDCSSVAGGAATPGISASPRAVNSSSSKGVSQAASDASTFLPAAVVAGVRERMERYAVWGAQVFDEAVDAAVAILHNDIFPRFQKSPLFARMMARERLAVDLDERALPHAHTLHVKPPRSQIRENVVGPNGESFAASYAGKHYTLEEFLEDGLLWLELHAHLDKSYSSESLICLRMIDIFKEVLQRGREDHHHHAQRSPRASRSMSNPEHHAAHEDTGVGVNLTPTFSRKRQTNIFHNAQRAIEDHAWNIYIYFVAVGAAHEIGIASKCRDAVMKDLASPHEHMFAELEAVALAELTTQFRDFRNTVAYEMIGRRVVAAAKVPEKSGMGSLLNATSMALSKRFAVHANS
jgi:hypothetical protein